MAGGGYSQSESEQRSQSGGPFSSASGTLRGLTQGELARTLFGPQIGSGVGGGGLVGMLRGRTTEPTGYTTPILSERGLLAEQEAGLRAPFQQAVQQALSGVSGAYARRGFTRPENIEAIAGSTAMNVAPQFANLYANLAGQNVAQRTQAPLVQEDMLRQRFADLLNSLGIGITALGGEATSYGSSKSVSGQASIAGKSSPAVVQNFGRADE